MSNRITSWLIAVGIFAAPIVCGKTTKPVIEPDLVRSGDCQNCGYHEVWIRADGMRFNSVTALKIDSQEGLAKLLPELRHLLSPLGQDSGRRSPLDHNALVSAIAFDGERRRAASAEALARYNRCATRPVEFDCTEPLEFPLMPRPGELLVFEVDRSFDGRWPGGHQMYFALIDAFVDGRNELVVRSDLPVFIEGDIEALPDHSGYRFRDRGYGFLAVSTAATWKEFASATARFEEDRLRLGAMALEKVPRAPFGSDEKKILETHWIWLRRNLKYQLAPIRNPKPEIVGPAPITTILESGIGNCDDLALMLVGLLRRDGVDAETVSVDTRDRPLTAVAVPRMDHAIVYIPALNRYVDPSLVNLRPLPTGGRLRYPFALHTSTGQVKSITVDQTR